jgi:hypothetical protein
LTELKNFVGGKFADTRDGRTSDVIDPSSGEAYAQAPISSAEDVDAALRAATDAFGTWRDATPAERSLTLLKIADAVEGRAAELAAAECRNTGKPVALTMSEELTPIVDQLRFFAGAARVLEGRSAGDYMHDHTSFVRREPIGVCAQVTPWNYPLMMAIAPCTRCIWGWPGSGPPWGWPTRSPGWAGGSGAGRRSAGPSSSVGDRRVLVLSGAGRVRRPRMYLCGLHQHGVGDQ